MPGRSPRRGSGRRPIQSGTARSRQERPSLTASSPMTAAGSWSARRLPRGPSTTRLSNSLGHVVVVTNRGLHTTSSVNSQQNRLTPDWSDTVTGKSPARRFIFTTRRASEWFSPTYHPLNDAGAAHEAEFGVDGSATFRMTRGELETELTVFVPPDEPAGIYLLTVRNHADSRPATAAGPLFPDRAGRAARVSPAR